MAEYYALGCAALRCVRKRERDRAERDSERERGRGREGASRVTDTTLPPTVRHRPPTHTLTIAVTRTCSRTLTSSTVTAGADSVTARAGLHCTCNGVARAPTGLGIVQQALDSSSYRQGTSTDGLKNIGCEVSLESHRSNVSPIDTMRTRLQMGSYRSLRARETLRHEGLRAGLSVLSHSGGV